MGFFLFRFKLYRFSCTHSELKAVSSQNQKAGRLCLVVWRILAPSGWPPEPGLSCSPSPGRTSRRVRSSHRHRPVAESTTPPPPLEGALSPFHKMQRSRTRGPEAAHQLCLSAPSGVPGTGLLPPRTGFPSGWRSYTAHITHTPFSPLDWTQQPSSTRSHKAVQYQLHVSGTHLTLSWKARE